MIELLLHDAVSEVRTVQVADDATVAGLIRQVGGRDADVAWLENGDVVLDDEVRLADVVRNHGHVHVGRRRTIVVTARFGGDPKVRDFSPAATIQAVFEWATGPHGFNLPPAERAKHEFVVCGTETIVERTAHVGTVAGERDELCLDLVPRDRFQG